MNQNTIPAGAADGSVIWVRADNLPVMGRLMLIHRRQGMASNYDCDLCSCPLNYTPSSDYINPGSLNLLVQGQGSLIFYTAYRSCNMTYFYYNTTASAAWSSQYSSIASVNTGTVKGLSGGTSLITAQFSDYGNWTDYPILGCQGTLLPGSPGGAAYVVSITGPQTAWWFNGQTPSGYATTITLTALPSGMSSYSWSLTAGTGKATLGGQSGNSINLTGADWSTSQGDVTVQVQVTTPAGSKFATYNVTVRGPYKLVPGYAPGGLPAYQDTAYGSGYKTYASYTIDDYFSTPMPYVVPLTRQSRLIL